MHESFQDTARRAANIAAQTRQRFIALPNDGRLVLVDNERGLFNVIAAGRVMVMASIYTGSPYTDENGAPVRRSLLDDALRKA